MMATIPKFRAHSDLRKYLQQNHSQLKWKEKVKISYDIMATLNHEDSHFQLDNINNLAYIPPEVIVGKQYTPASVIFGFGILMWEISSGQPPFDYQYDRSLAVAIVEGVRPKIVSGTPLKYEMLMKQCW